MKKREGYLYYQAGQAVAAVHMGLTIRQVSANPADGASEIALPRDNPKARMILWFSGMTAETKGAGKGDPLRRMRNRARLAALVSDIKNKLRGSPARRQAHVAMLRSQAQDRANDISVNLWPAIEIVVDHLHREGIILGVKVEQVVTEHKKRRVIAVPDAAIPPAKSRPDKSAR